MNIRNNPPRRTALVWTGIILIGIIIIFIPAMTGMDGFNGGFALSVGGGFVAMVGIIAAVIYFRLGSSLDRITSKEYLLVHWTYTAADWKRYTEKEHREDSAAKKGLFILVAIIAVIVGIIFFAVVRDNPLVIAVTVLGIIVITGLTAYFSTLASYLNNKRRLGETYLALDGVYLNRAVHIWKGIGNRLEAIAFDSKGKNSRIIITYSSPGTHSRNSYTVRVPVPPGEEIVAQSIVEQIAATHLGEPG